MNRVVGNGSQIVISHHLDDLATAAVDDRGPRMIVRREVGDARTQSRHHRLSRRVTMCRPSPTQLVVRVDAAATAAHDSPQPDEKGLMVWQPIGTPPARRQLQPPRMVRDRLRRSRSRQRNRRTIPNACNRISPRRASLREHGRQVRHRGLVPSHGVTH